MNIAVETKGRREIPLYKVPSIIPLEYNDEKAREAVRNVLLDYKGTVAALSTFDPELEEGPVRGSNIYSRFALANAYRNISGEDVRPILPRESETALVNDALVDPKETYEDLGLPVFPKQGHNPKLWKSLREQVKSIFPNINLEQPFVFTGLADVIEDNYYENELRLDFTELTEAYNVPVLNKAGEFMFSSEDPQLQKIGFPSKLGEGNRKLYVGDSGVCRFSRNGGLYLNASNHSLGSSYDTGRVHLVRNFSGPNLEVLVDKLEQERLEHERKLEKYNEALAIFRGK